MNNNKRFKQLFIGSIDKQHNRFILDKESIKEWGVIKGGYQGKVYLDAKLKGDKIIDSKWIIDEIDYIIFSTDEYEDFFHEYQMLCEQILLELIAQKNVSMFFEYFQMVLIEFSKLPSEHGSGKQNTLDESFILHSRLIVPEIIKFYKQNIHDEKFAETLLKLSIDLAHYILLPFPDDSLITLPIKRPIPISESNKSLHDIGWQQQAYEDYYDVYNSLKVIGVKDEIQIMKSVMTELNQINSNNRTDINVINLLQLEDDEDITLSIMEKNNYGDLIRKRGLFNEYLVLFSKMFLNNPEYCLDTLLNEIHEIISKTNDRKELDNRLFNFSQTLINLFIINDYKNNNLLGYSLKYASWISINTVNCYCGKYQGSRYNGIDCDRCGVHLAESGLKKGAFDYIFNKLSGKEVFGWNHNKLKGDFKDFNYDEDNISIFILYLNKIEDIDYRRNLFLSLLLFNQKNEFSIRDKLIKKFIACQSDSLDEFMIKSNFNYSDWIEQNLTTGSFERKNYYNNFLTEKNKLLYDESKWHEESFIENILLNKDPWFENYTDIDYDVNEYIEGSKYIDYKEYLYEIKESSDYTKFDVRKSLKKNLKELSKKGLNEPIFLSQIGDFYCTLIENYKKDKNIKFLNLCIDDFIKSVNKNGEKSNIKFIKIILDLNRFPEIIQTLNNIEKNKLHIIHYIIKNTEINNSLRMSSLYKRSNGKDDFIIINQKFHLMDKTQIYTYLYQFAENLNALNSFLSYLNK